MLTLQEAHQIEGYWWFPHTPDHKIAGTLTFDQTEGGVLKLNGLLCELEQAFSTAKAERVVIYGVSRKGKPITLLNFFNRRRNFNFPGLSTEEYCAGISCIGLHFEDPDAPIFDKSWFRFDGIEAWLGREACTVEVDHENRQFTLRSQSTREEVFARAGDQSIAIGASVRTEKGSDTQMSLIVETSLAVTPDNPQALEWHFENATRLQSLASLCTGAHLPLTALEVRGPSTTGANKAEAALISVLVHLQNATRGPRPNIPIMSGRELTRFNADAITRWLAEYDDLASVLPLFFTVLADRNLLVNVRFLLAVQAIEAFHRATSPGGLISSDEHRTIQDTLMAAIPRGTSAAMREKLKGTLAFSNEPSLRQRLKSVVAGITERYGNAPPGLSKSAISSIVDTRNYNTHHTPDLKNKALDGSGMHWESRRLMAVLTVLLLERLGVPPGSILQHVERHREFHPLWSSAGYPA